MGNCIQCGKCCQSVFLLVDSAETDNGKDHHIWAEFHDLKTEFCIINEKKYWGVRLQTPCKHLEKHNKIFSCKIYRFRPKMCVNYTGKAEFSECGYNK
jgi:Fe-S-cluster containining protein